MPETSTTPVTFRERALQHEHEVRALSDAYRAQRNLDWIDFHCDAFHVPAVQRQSAALTGLREIVRAAESAVIESSVKVSGGSANPARFNLLCIPANKPAFAAQLLQYVDDVARAESVALNTAPLLDLVSGMNCARVTRMVCGVDLREDRTQSRLKVWFFADDDPSDPNNPVQRALARTQVDAAFHALHVHPALLFGYDMRFDGTTALKLYPDIWQREHQQLGMQQRLSTALSPESLALMHEAFWTHIYLTQREQGPVLDLHLTDPDSFVARHLNTPLTQSIHAAYANVPLLDVVAAIPQRELSKPAIEDFTLYYMPAPL